MVSSTDGRVRQHAVVGGGSISEHTGTSSPSPAGSTYTTASESGGPNTIESEPGTYLSASEDLVNMVNSPSRVVMPVSTAVASTVMEAANYGPVVNYNRVDSGSGYCNSAEVTMIPQQHAVPVATHDLRVSKLASIFFGVFFPIFCRYLCR